MGFLCDFWKLPQADVTVDSGDAEGLSVGKFQAPAAADGLRLPVFFQSGHDEIPGLRARAQGRGMAFSAAADVEVLGTPVVVPEGIVGGTVRLPLGSVAGYLAADRGRAALQNSCNFSEAEALSQKFL